MNLPKRFHGFQGCYIFDEGCKVLKELEQITEYEYEIILL